MAEAKKKAPVKKGTTTKPKMKAAGFMHCVMTLDNEAKEQYHLKGVAIFDDGSYVDQKAVHLVEVAKRNGGEITVPMMVTFRANKETVLPEESDLPLQVKE